MRVSLIALAFAIAGVGSAYASPHHVKLNCGWPHPDPGCVVTPPTPIHVTPTPAPSPVTPAAPGSPAEIEGVLQALVEVQTQFVADVANADLRAAQVIPPATGPIDIIGHTCYPVLGPWAASLSIPGIATGMTASITGTVLTPISGTPVLSAGEILTDSPVVLAPNTTITGPGTAAGTYNVTPSQTVAAEAMTAAFPGSGLVATFEDLRIANIEAQNTISNIASTGIFPPFLTAACGGLITDTITQEGKIAGEIAAFPVIIAAFIPKPLLVKHGVGHLAKYSHVPDAR